MKITGITLCNFKNFKGEYSIDLSTNEQKKIVLICGPNGAGKTSILESIKLCMYGRRFNGKVLSNKDYENYIISLKNKSSIKEKDERFFVQIDIELDDVFPYSINIKREWKIINDKSIKETFTIFHKDKELEIVPKEHWEDFIVSLFPPYIFSYFFFDGEKIKELVVGDNAESMLRESIRDLTGLKLYETLLNDVNFLISKIKRRNIKLKDLKVEIRSKEKEIVAIQRKISEINSKIELKSKKIRDLSEKKEIIEIELRRKAGAVAKERNKIEREVSKLNQELGKLNNEIRQICEDVLPFVIPFEVRKNLLEQLKKERRLKELIASERMLREINQDLITRLEQRLSTLSKDYLQYIKEEVNSIFLEKFEEINNGVSEKLLHDLTSAEMDRIENFLKKVEERAKTNLQNALKNREKLMLQLKKFKDKLKQITDEDFVENYIMKLSSIQTEIEILTKEITSLRNERETLINERERVLSEIRRLEEEIVCLEEDSKKIDVCIKIKNALSEIIDFTLTMKVKELENIITDLYQKLTNKRNIVKEIKIDPKSFLIKLVGFGGEIIDKENISAGEKEIYVLSALWGLSKLANMKFPIIVDTLLSRLDRVHVKNVVKNFFPNAREQVIVLAHDREFNEEIYDILKPYISKEYLLSLGETNKIREVNLCQVS